MREGGDTTRVVRTDAWQLSVPGKLTETSPLLVIPTVHPRGDRRIMRCAQVALDSGFRIAFYWLGDGRPSDDPAVEEVLFPAPASARERIARTRVVAAAAEREDAVLWHIHDYYFLPLARRWNRRTRRPVLYDVHEYYADYYAEKLPLPSVLRKLLARMLDGYQGRLVRRMGGANVVAPAMVDTFARYGAPVSVSPNYPLLEQFEAVPLVPFAERRWRVVHSGTLTPSYGTEPLVALVHRSHERGLPFEFEFIARHPSGQTRREFERILSSFGVLPNLRLVDPRPTHEMPMWLSRAGFGLSYLAPNGQNAQAIPSKLYEYLTMGIVGVVSALAAQRGFVEANMVGVVDKDDDPDLVLDRMLELASAPDVTQTALDAARTNARERFTWENGSAPGLSRVLAQLTGRT